jgi:hypothetical protein
MILNEGKIFKSFAEQRKFSFDSYFFFQNASGISTFSVSGASGEYDLFSFINGRIFDNSNKFVSCYSPDQEVNISGNFSSGSFGYYIDKKPIDLSLSMCPEDFSFENLIFSTTGFPFEFYVDVFGDYKPTCGLFFDSSDLLTGSAITGYLNNTSSQPFGSFKIFSNKSSFPNSSYVIASGLVGEKIKPGSSGQIVLDFIGGTSFPLDASRNPIPISGDVSFSTSFGDIVFPSVLEMKSSPAYYINFELGPFARYGETGSLWSLALERQACSGTSFEFSFDDIRWLDPYHQFSDSFSVKYGPDNGSFISFNANYNALQERYVGTGYIGETGCLNNDTYITRFEIFQNHPSGVYLNKFSYSISGIEEKFLYTGSLE